MGDELDSGETVRALMAGVRAAAERIKHRIPAHVDVNDVVSAGYLALTQALAEWPQGAIDSFEELALGRASAAMIAALRAKSPELGATDPSELHGLVESTRLGAANTIVAPPRLSEEPEGIDAKRAGA